MKELKKFGIEVREGFISATLQKYFQKYNLIKKGNCLIAEKNSYSSFYLPTYIGLNLKDQKFITKKLIKICDKNLTMISHNHLSVY